MENKDNKILLAKILGEIYRLQKHSQNIPCPASDARIYGLLNGFERIVDEEIERIGFVSNKELSTVEKILDEYFINEEKLKQFKGYYDIERELEVNQIDRAKAITI